MTTLNINLLAEKSSELASYITKLHFAHNPDLLKRYGLAGKKLCCEDAIFHLNSNLPTIYSNYIVWAAAMLKSRKIPETDLIHNLDFVHQAIHKILGSQFSPATKKYAATAQEKQKESTEEGESYFTNDNPLKNEVETYLEYLLQGKRREATLMITELIQQDISIKKIYQHIFQISQYEVGRLWQNNKITVAHEHYCTAATQQIMAGLYQHIFSSTRKGKTMVACSISGELHEMGIRMVTDFFEMDGWDTYYLGANMPDNQLLKALIDYKADILALSISLPTNVSKVATLIKKIRKHKDLAHVKIMVGGYPFLTIPNLWQKVSADAYAHNADTAIIRANELIYQ